VVEWCEEALEALPAGTGTAKATPVKESQNG
jgi:hypothetical protein